jgi:D-xylose transport system substrate-binding protein
MTGKVFVAGADADLTATKAILKGKQSMTVLKGIKPLAEAAVKAAIQLANQQPVKGDSTMNNGKKDVAVISTEVLPVVKDTVDKVIIGNGFHTKEAVYGKS